MTTTNINDTLEYIKDILSKREKFKIINVNGDFLTGKTTTVQNLISDINFINQYNVYSYINDWEKYNYLFDITADFFENSNLHYPEFTSDESKYFVNSFFDCLSTLNISNKELFKEINQYLLLETNNELSLELKEKIENGIKNELKRNLLIHSLNISIECLIADLLNNFFPLNQQIESLSDYLLSREPIKILLIFDDAQSISKKIKKWFKEFFKYMTSKKLGDLMLYDYNGKDSQILLGEFFTIDLLFISRNEKLKINGQDIYNCKIELEYPAIEESYSQFSDSIDSNIYRNKPIWGIPPLASYYNLVEKDKVTATSIFAVNNLLKYIPKDYQRIIIFSSIFDEFSLRKINLFNEVEISKNEFDKLINKIDFITKDGNTFRLRSTAKSILGDVNKIIYENLDFAQLNKISDDIDEEFSELNYEEFETLRELAYFKQFDKNYVIENYFNNNKKINQFIESNPEFFNKEKSFFSIIEKYSEILIRYNIIRDSDNYNIKSQNVEETYYKYQNEIEKRNLILQEDVVNVGNETKELTNQKVIMEDESELLAKQAINLQNEIKEINLKLKPFIHINSKKKSTINLIALITSVAIIFNSDRISELLFGVNSDFEYVILITFILLLLLYGNGLLRYFRIKFKSEELHSLKQNKSNKEKEYIKLQSELDVKNADIRAKVAKIEDLKKHIERMNKQIFENKQKVEKKFMH